MPEPRTKRRNEGFDVEHRVYLLEADLDLQDSSINRLAETLTDIGHTVEDKIDEINKRMFGFALTLLVGVLVSIWVK